MKMIHANVPAERPKGGRHDTANRTNAMKQIKRMMVMVVGGTVLAIGIALIVLPGPAFIVIPLGLAILAVEFAWARRWLHKARELLQRKNRSVARKEVA